MNTLTSKAVFDVSCRLCPRLAGFLKDQRHAFPQYYNSPVPPFGDPRAQLLVVGLAPGLHGANASGRPFTGDHAGLLLYRTLHRFGFASAPQSLASDDGLQLVGCRITNAVKCVPPQNKPLPAEIRTCNRYLAAELQLVSDSTVIVALGTIAHNAVLTGFKLQPARYKFAHGNEHVLPNKIKMIDSYHCSRYNTQTRRLTEEMFASIFARAKELLAVE
jgi:uracil-DNA glycosylase